MKTTGELIQGRSLHTVRAQDTVALAASTLVKHRIGAVPVTDGDRVVGIFSERDLMVRVVVAGRRPEATRVEEVMTRDLLVVAPDETHSSCLSKMARVGCRHLPVVSNGKLLGFLSQRDLLAVDLNEKEEELKLMSAYIRYVPTDLS